MTTKGVKRPRDAIQLGVLIVDIVSQVEDEGARLTLIRRSSSRCGGGFPGNLNLPELGGAAGSGFQESGDIAPSASARRICVWASSWLHASAVQTCATS